MIKNPIQEVTNKLQYRAIGIVKGIYKPNNIDQLKNFKDQTILVKYEEDSRKDSVLGKLLSVSDNHIEIMNNKMESIKISSKDYITSKLIYKG